MEEVSLLNLTPVLGTLHICTSLPEDRKDQASSVQCKEATLACKKNWEDPKGIEKKIAWVKKKKEEKKKDPLAQCVAQFYG